MRIIQRVAFFFAALVLFFASAFHQNSFAQDEQPKSDPQAKLESADLDGDGKVTTKEINAFLSKQYLDAWTKKVDANGDGTISEEEFKDRRQAIAQIVVAEEDEANRLAKKERRRKARERIAARKNMTSIDRMNEGYLKEKPRIGHSLKELTAFDENGKEFDFEDLKGKHTVIVFGCLT